MQATESSHISLDAVDMRKGFDGLYGLARDHLRQNPQSGVAAILSVVESCRRIGAPVRSIAGCATGVGSPQAESSCQPDASALVCSG
jgi:hypothetical protein